MNIPEGVARQYSAASNLRARMQLHERFGVSAQPWMAWVMDQFALPAQARILEVGCGVGKLWQENAHRLPPGWDVTLTDQSAGMLSQAQANLAGAGHSFQFEQVDVQSLPYAGETFDAVVANHMLYHVPDLPAALGEIRRVLKPRGALIAATNGERHMVELHELVERFAPEIASHRWREAFSLETGLALLAPFFADVERRRYTGGLRVTEAGPLVAYIMSTELIAAEQRAPMARFVEAELASRGGMIEIQQDTGLFRAMK